MEDYRVPSDKQVDLSTYKTYYQGKIKRKAGRKQLIEKSKTLRDLQELFYAEGKQKLLVILQGIDASGKDGTIKNIFGRVNPQGTKVTSFKVPTRKELAHDYLWRIHKKTPGAGEMVIFNRSHYEDVLVARVAELVPVSVWEKRYQHINEFERMLTDEGTTILKFFLHISKERQARRFLARLDRSNKRWKFDPHDLVKREDWDKYKTAFEDMLTKTSTPWASWHVIPSDRKWYRNLSIATIIVETLQNLGMRFPEEVEDIDSYKRQLQAMIRDKAN